MSVCVCIPNSWQQLFAIRRHEQWQRDGPVEPGTGAWCSDRQTGTSDAVGHRQSGTKRQFVWETVRELGKYRTAAGAFLRRCTLQPRLEIKFLIFQSDIDITKLCNEILQSVL